MDGEEGEKHPYFGAFIMCVFGMKWYYLCLCHSRFLAKKMGMKYSRLCVADKLAIAITPPWIFIPMTRLTGELQEYMSHQNGRTPGAGRTPYEWHKAVRTYCKNWAYEHKDGKEDKWTGTNRDKIIK